MKAIIHVGMSKTGSSAIQRSFTGLRSDQVHYVNWPRPNHSDLFVLLFEDEDRLEDYLGFAIRGETRPGLLERRDVAMGALQDELAAAPAPLVVFSGEVIANRRFENATRRLHGVFSRYCSEVTAIGYVRPPISFIQSAFQQRLKGGTDRFNPYSLWPGYRDRFEHIDRVFGRENVTLKKFDPKGFAGSDVVVDFGHEIGVEIAPGDVRRVNESLSLEAAALLFVQRRFGGGFVGGCPDAPRANRDFVEALRGIGATRFGFTAALVDPVVEENTADLDWIEARLGVPLRDAAPDAGRLIGSGGDLIAVALENADAVGRLLEEAGASGAASRSGGPLARLAAMLDRLYQRARDTRLPVGKAPPS